MYFINMILCFVILSGAAAFFGQVICVNMGEGMLLTASMIALFFYVSSLAGSFSYGLYGIVAVAAIGIILLFRKVVKDRRKAAEYLSKPAFWCIAFMFAASLVFLYHDFIQHIDEFHHWAAAVKYMLEKDRMPTGNDFLAGAGYYGFATSLFHLFFQKIVGYNEQSMYVSSLLLAWIGFMLPFSGYEKKDWKKLVLYNVIVYIALYSLYVYGSKSLYVDVVTAAWAGGLAGWWMNRDRKKANGLILLSGIVMMPFMKESAGLLMSVLVLVFVVVETLVIEKGYLKKEKSIRNLILLGVVLVFLLLAGCAALRGFIVAIEPVTDGAVEEVVIEEHMAQALPWSFAGIQLPDRLCDMINAFKITNEKAQSTLGSFITKAAGSDMSSRDNWHMAFLPFAAVMLILFKVIGDITGKKKEAVVYILYSGIATMVYCAAVYFSYVFMFAYELSVNLRSVTRYFSIMCIYLMVIAFAWLLKEKWSLQGRKLEYLTYGVLVFLILGINTKFIPNSTAVDKKSITGYSQINGTVKQINKINSVIEEDDKVYLICQTPEDDLGDSELILAPALYYLDGQISNYLRDPWNFHEDGSNVRLENLSSFSIEDLPKRLAKDGYSYVWVHTTDEYLDEHLPEVLECEKVKSGYLYEIVYEDGAAAGLKPVKKLR